MTLNAWATNDLKMTDLMRLKYAEISWMVETYHRGIKQFCGIERCQARSERAQRNHIEMALRAFLRIEYSSFDLHGYQKSFTLDLSIFSIFLRTEACYDLFY